MKKNNKLELGIILSLALIVIIVSFFIVFRSSKEALFGEVIAIPDDLESTCYDTDPLNNLNQVGIVTDSSGERFKDSCLGLFTAVQYNCSSDGSAEKVLVIV